MTNEEQKTAIQNYISAYKSFDVKGMISLVHPAVAFKNVVGGEVNAETVGVDQFRKLAIQSKSLFSFRQQSSKSFTCTEDIATVEIAYEGVLAVDLPNGMKAGESLRLTGRSEFEFKDGKIYKITDIS